MQDRVSQYPGRVKLTPVSGQENVYDMEWADGATVAGTALNKASLLTDATAALFGLGADAVPDDVLEKARSLITAAQNTANSANSSANNRLKIITGSYTGSGSDSKTISVSGTPHVLLIARKYSEYYGCVSVAIRGYGVLGLFTSYLDGPQSAAEVDVSFGSGSIQLSGADINNTNATYYYAVLCI